MSWGTFWLSIITPKKSQRPFKEKENVLKSQREFKVKTKKLPKAHLIGCRREWHEYSGPITERSTATSMKFRITWDTQLNTQCSSTQISNWKLLPSNTHDHDGHLFLQFQPQGGLKTIERDENVLNVFRQLQLYAWELR